MHSPSSWAHRLNRQRELGLFRQAKVRPEGFADFCSNDFLGLGQEQIDLIGIEGGSTGSRLVSGLNAGLEALEAWACGFFHAESAVYFPSGYQANLAVINALATRHDQVLMDERIHASWHDAGRLSPARTHFFRHNSTHELNERLHEVRERTRDAGEIYVITESIFSMTATGPRLADMQAVCEKYGATLIVDEAHAVGLYGTCGVGLTEGCHVPVRVMPLGKAAGSQGAFVLGLSLLRLMLENFARPLIFSTAPAPVLVASVLNRCQAMVKADERREKLAHVKSQVAAWLGLTEMGSFAPIYPADGDWDCAIRLAKELRLWVKPIRYPTVPKGEECFRLTLHAYQTEEELERLRQWLAACDLRPVVVANG